MELKEFIAQTIIQITDGLRDGHQYVIDNKYGQGIHGTFSREVTFDIAVSSNEEESSGVKGVIAVARILSAGAQENSKSISSNVSRIQFKISLHVETKQKP